MDRTAITEINLRELRETHAVDDAAFRVDDAEWLHTALQRDGSISGTNRIKISIAVNVSFEKYNTKLPLCRTVSVRANQKQLRHGFNPSPSGTTLLPKHDQLN